MTVLLSQSGKTLGLPKVSYRTVLALIPMGLLFWRQSSFLGLPQLLVLNPPMQRILVTAMNLDLQDGAGPARCDNVAAGHGNVAARVGELRRFVDVERVGVVRDDSACAA